MEQKTIQEELIAIALKGEEIFGTIKEYVRWLNSPLLMSNQLPCRWLDSSEGRQILFETLERIAHGYPL